MMKILKYTQFLFLLLLLVTGCGSGHRKTIDSVTCNEQIDVQYAKTSAEAKKDGLEVEKNLNSSLVVFLNDFEEQIIATIDNKEVFNEFVSNRNNSVNTNKYFYFDYRVDNPNPVLKISIPEKDICFDIEIKKKEKKYGRIYVFLTRDGKFHVRFTNQIYIGG